MVVSEITIKKSGDSFFIRGCPNEAGDIPTFKELSPKSASTEIIQKINEVNEFALEFSEQGDFQEFIAENGTKYRIFNSQK